MGQNGNYSDAEQVVRDLFDSWKPSSEAFYGSFDRFFDENTVWENVGLSKTTGKDEAIAFVKAFPIPMAYMTAAEITTASSGDTVFAERVDYFHDEDGKVLLEAWVNGIFVIKNGKIAEWRDYADTAGLGARLQELAGPPQ
ncbi:limonene-1,2-epoxide hydrolase family protein [Pseudonocardia alni]|uniref:limonene-1,2-epoxide hydrolase family protein n=1 Tax=Pseudonocardia alni TaxID=33907 RepID=UPI00280AFD47|nr:limonene-1,2-epoxide hydrolase family protein [Pseudonocardia alni]